MSSSASGSSDVLVVGTINVDLVATARRRPAAGETVVAEDFHRSPGGKGANQAVAAARAGVRVRLLAAVGDDDAGAAQVHELERDGVRTDLVARVQGSPTGMAMITVTPDGENSIVVVPGANAALDAEHLDAALSTAGAPVVLLLQSEVGPHPIDRAAARADPSTRVVLSNGPWVSLAACTLRRADPLVLNQHEARDACADLGLDAAGVPVRELARTVREATGAASVLVTLGAEGVSLSDGRGDSWVPAATAPTVVDTTGAGDVFAGTLAGRLAAEDDLRTAVEAAAVGAALSVTWPGARPPAGARSTSEEWGPPTTTPTPR